MAALDLAVLGQLKALLSARVRLQFHLSHFSFLIKLGDGVYVRQTPGGAIMGTVSKGTSLELVICDPTYIGASIGLAMPQFKNVAAKVLKY